MMLDRFCTLKYRTYGKQLWMSGFRMRKIKYIVIIIHDRFRLAKIIFTIFAYNTDCLENLVKMSFLC